MKTYWTHGFLCLLYTSNVLPIGGLKEKSMAAHRCGITTVLIPKANVKDLDDVPQTVKESVNFIPVERVSQVLDVALVK